MRRLIGITAKIIDGKTISDGIIDSLAQRVYALKLSRGIVPGLAVVLAGDDPASAVYVRNKQRACERAGINSFVKKFDGNVGMDTILGYINELNDDISVHGILVQLPLPRHISSERIIRQISPFKDVDGFHPINAGRLMQGLKCIEPCTPKAVMWLVDYTGTDLTGKSVCIIGRSNIVGKPAGMMFLKRDATVTMCHSKTVSLEQAASSADVLVVAAGKPEMIDDRHVKSGSIVIDVGINRIDGNIVGDVDFAKAAKKAGWITPVPGGVGPMTIAMLIENTFLLACGGDA